MANAEGGFAGGTPAGSEGLFADIAGFLAPHQVLIVGIFAMSSSGTLSCAFWPVLCMLYLTVSLGIVGAAQWRFNQHWRLVVPEEVAAVRKLLLLLVTYYLATSVVVLIGSLCILCH